MVRLPQSELVKSLKKAGLTVKEFELALEGEHTVEDADWNFKDVPHHNFIHPSLTHIPSSVADDVASDIRLQKFFGILLPVSNVGYISAENQQTSHSTFFLFTMVNETRFEAIDSMRTRAVTKYAIAAPSFLLAIFFPFIKRSITKNFHMLMADDFPMRERRGELRKKGLTFLKNKTFSGTLDINQQLTVPPGDRMPEESVAISLGDLKPGQVMKIGESDHFGLQILLKENSIEIYPRLCPHAGACLDVNTPPSNSSVMCEWHGRYFKPILSVGKDKAEGAYESKFHNFYFESNILNISFRIPEGPLERADWTKRAAPSEKMEKIA